MIRCGAHTRPTQQENKVDPFGGDDEDVEEQLAQVSYPFLNIQFFDLNRHLKTTLILLSFYIYKDRDVARIITHPAFESKRIWNDVGVLFVQQDFDVTDHISPVCIPSNPDDDGDYMSENCVATGWGRNKYGKRLND